MDVTLAAVGALGMVVAALSRRIRRMPITEPLLGLLLGIALGPAVTGFLTLPPLTEWSQEYHQITRILLAVSVLAVALRFPIRQIRAQVAPVLLLLAVAMPAMAAVNTGLGMLVLGMAPATALLLGTALCPTDPVLASNVVSGEPAEQDIHPRVRQLLSIESGANDGLAMPLVLFALVAVGATTAGTAAWQSVWETIGGIALGIVLGWVGGKALRLGEEHGATETTPALFFTLLLGLGVLGAASLIHTNDVLAVFAAGLAFNYVSTGGERGGSVAVDEGINRFLVLPVFVVIGAILPWQEWADLGWRGPVLVIAVLLLRRLPILIALHRPLRLRWPDTLFLGWFGPVGISAMFYLTLEAERHQVNPTLIAAGMLIIAASTVAHGVTAVLGRVLYRHYSALTPAPDGQR